MFVVAKKDFPGLIRDFRAALEWLETLGVRVHVGRLNAYARFCSRFEQAPAQSAAVLNFVEISRIVDVWKHRDRLRALGNFEQRICCIPRGTRLHRDDQDHTARNHLFELFCAAWLVELGMTLLPSTEGDVTAELQGRRFVVECKRPSSVQSLPAHVRKASRQAHERRTGRAVGAVLVDLTLLINPELQYWEVRTDDEAVGKIKSYVDSAKGVLHDLLASELRSPADAFIGCYGWIPFFNNTSREWSVGEQWLTLGNPDASCSARYWHDVFNDTANAHLLARKGSM